MKRASGILLHITSLSSDFGIGDLGPGAYKFVDFLEKSNQHYWQVLPLNVTDPMFGNSPYSSISAFAADPILISPELMVKEGWLKKGELKSQFTLDADKVNYKEVRSYKTMIFDIAFRRFLKGKNKVKGYSEFCSEHSHWLEDFALFVVLKELFPEGAWNTWDREMMLREINTINKAYKKYQEKIEKVKFLQFVFMSQWQDLKEYCHSKGVSLIGDIPIYVNFDSSDVWSHPEFYKLDGNYNPTFVSGVPPDYFSETGQRWGNPVYDWNKLKETNYGWWIDRMTHNLKLFDLVRIDHFRGLIAYWEIPAQEQTAMNGSWTPVPWQDFFSMILRYVPQKAIIAEDLGIITDDVKESIRQLGFPGMKILHFAFSGEQKTHPYLPHNYIENAIVYTGTHDNNTTVGWFKNDATDEEKQNLFKYTGKIFTEKDVNWGLIELAMNSRANLALFPLQDVLGLGEECKMNKPSTMNDDNWSWRFTDKAITANHAEKLKEYTVKAKR